MKTLMFSLHCAAAGVGYNDGPIEPSLVDGPRVLGVRQVPQGDTIVVEVLAPYATAFRWIACPAPFLPALEPTCPVPAQTLSDGNPLVINRPLEGARLWLRLDAQSDEASALPTVLRVRAEPGVAEEFALIAPDGADLPASITSGGDVPVVVYPPPAVDDTVTWFTSAGLFETWRTRGAVASVLTTPPAGGELTVWAVIRSASGAVSWASRSFEVTE